MSTLRKLAIVAPPSEPHRTVMSIAKLVILGALALAGCDTATGNTTPDAIALAEDASPDGPAPCVPTAGAPTFSQLYTSYFAENTEGHCAKATCHGNPNHQIWLCGPDKVTCYDGMVSAGLINKKDPKASRIADPRSSPLRWVNLNGAMPADRVREFEAGRDAITAWVASCAQNN
jgi:hypothetical protein